MTFPKPPETARCWAEIDCEALRHNAALARRLVGPGAAILAVVKADAYGHGLAPVARELAAGKEVSRFGVANLAEATQLREALPGADITLLSTALPAERAEIVRRRLRPWISSLEEAQGYARAAVAEAAAPFPVEIKIDTGMGRAGVLEAEAAALIEAVRRLPSLRLDGLVTHLPVADEDELFTREQLVRFSSQFSNSQSPGIPHRQAQNSAGLMAFRAGGCDVVRPGLMLYGSSPLPRFQAQLRPALTLKTRVILVRELPAGWGVSYGRAFVTPRPMRVATLAAGYGDGYPRHLSNAGAEVLLRGRRCPVLGRVTMDQIMVDVGAVEPPRVAPGEEVVLIGRQDGEEILAAELAAKAGTIAWEIFTGLTTRVARSYFHEA